MNKNTNGEKKKKTTQKEATKKKKQSDEYSYINDSKNRCFGRQWKNMNEK